MNESEDLSPAFPQELEVNGAKYQYHGLSRREYFAAAALQGLLASDANTEAEAFAKAAVELADALIAELDK